MHQVAIADVGGALVLGDQPEGRLVAGPVVDMAVDRLIGDIELAARQAIQKVPGLFPGKGLPFRRIVMHVRMRCVVGRLRYQVFAHSVLPGRSRRLK
jgi:hypothetical protein